jgi:diguanylate cyclase (GGDEF)-like protein
MPDTKPSDVAQKLEELKLRFREKASVDLEQLQVVAGKIADGTCMAEDVCSVYHSLHRLAGSAGTFGYTALGDEARQLELALKPLLERSPEQTDNQPDSQVEQIRLIGEAQHLMTPGFLSRITGLGVLLEQSGERSEGVAGPLPSQVKPGSVRKSVVQIIDNNPARAAELASDLALHGFETLVCASAGEAESHRAPGLSAIVIRATQVLADKLRLDALGGSAPVICIGARDVFAKRYQLAELGASGFLYDPVDVPVLADYIERLIKEQQDGVSGRVMIVDDDPELLEHYSLVLEDGGLEVFRVNDPSDILYALSEFRPDIVLMDIQMGSFNGPVLARMLRFDQEWLGLPIIYLSSEEDKEFQLEAMSQGGDDFLTKPVSDAFLLRAITVRCYRARQLDKLASRDSLTGLLKHSLAKSEVRKEHARCLRLEHESVIAMLDLDHFKQVNDRYGHRTGDLVIKGLANLLRHRLRDSDVIGRYGGEEFIVALPDCSVADARVVLQSVCDQLSRIVFTAGDQEFTVTLSAGMALLNRFSTSDGAIEAADQALYQRKQAGRNGITVSGDQ